MSESPDTGEERPEPVSPEPAVGTTPSELPRGGEPREVVADDPLIGIEGGATLKRHLQSSRDGDSRRPQADCPPVLGSDEATGITRRKR